MRDEINLKTNKQIIEINYAYLVNQEEWLFIGFTFSNTIAVVDESYTRIYLYEFFFFLQYLDFLFLSVNSTIKIDCNINRL